PDFRTDVAAGNLTVGAHKAAIRRIGEIVARVANDGGGKRRQSDLWKQSVDRHAVGRVDLLVEQFGSLDLIRPADADCARDPAPEVRGERPAGEGEARSVLLLECSGEKGVRRRSENARFTIGPDHAVLAESSRSGLRLKIAETDARKQVDRAVLPEQIP